MNEPREAGTDLREPQEEADLVTMVKRIQQQLTFIEKKVDTLIQAFVGISETTCEICFSTNDHDTIFFETLVPFPVIS